MGTINEVEKEIESLTIKLFSEKAQQIFSTIVFKKRYRKA